MATTSTDIAWSPGRYWRRGTDVVRVSRIQAEALDDDAEEMPQGGQCTHLASCLFQATEIWGLSFTDLVHWHQVAGVSRWISTTSFPACASFQPSSIQVSSASSTCQETRLYLWK